MTIWDLTRIMRKDKNYLDSVIKPALGKEIDGLTQKINNLNSIKAFLRSEGFTWRVTNNPPTLFYKIDENLSEAPKILPKKIVSENEVERPPIVTIMGHVDHGKTTLLDALRNSNIVEKEFGGITQHIGAFSVQLHNGKSVTFIDTPGHAAFSSMRNRGAEVTDIIILIVAADDGIMEQTIESIKMAQNFAVPIVVAVNKIDKVSGDLTKIKHDLLSAGVQAEDLGGDVQIVPISALKRKNLDLLIEAILIQADLLALTSDPSAPVEGIIIESSIGPRGKQATVLVKRGTLRPKALLLAGKALAVVRAMFDENGLQLDEVKLSQPAQVIGWKDLPHAGDVVVEIDSRREAKSIIREGKKHETKKKNLDDYIVIQERAIQSYGEFVEKKKEIIRSKAAGDIEQLKEIYRRKRKEESEELLRLNIIVKGDVDGSIDAILDVIGTYDCDDQCKLDIVHSGVGPVTEKDIDLASTFNAIIFCFNVPCPKDLKEMIISNNIKIRFHNVIYHFIDDLKSHINEKLPQSEEEEIIGSGQVLEHFTVNEKNKKTSVAGCICEIGEFKRDGFFRVIRSENVIYDGLADSMKHFKNEVNTIKKDSQCGIMFKQFQFEFKTGDKIICYKKKKINQTSKWNPGF
ncbi:UNVERIFIED_CONTAM: hypothetical protein PYX00_007028 [Menopon gallinae]